MPKNKLSKYGRVKLLPNVTFSTRAAAMPPNAYPWYENRYEGMQKILELGCGKAEHSLAFAAADPRKLCVGVDMKSHRMCVGAEKAIAAGLENIQFLRAQIEHIEDFFEKDSIHEIWITFPDPHPKTKAIKCRLSAPSFLAAYANLLLPGGRVYLKTDSELFYNYTRKSVQLWGGHVMTESENIDEIEFRATSTGKAISAYESAARSKGAAIKFMAFTLN
jgi:tRNA (guanine-N7-)-methyltransferase